jgi:hypothetical protein
MGVPARVHFEYRLALNVSGPGRRPSLPDGIRYRVEKAIKRRAEILGLRVYSLRFDSGRIQMDYLIQPSMVKANIERTLHGAINGIMKKEMPHLVKRTGQKFRAPLGNVIF